MYGCNYVWTKDQVEKATFSKKNTCTGKGHKVDLLLSRIHHSKTPRKPPRTFVPPARLLPYIAPFLSA